MGRFLGQLDQSLQSVSYAKWQTYLLDLSLKGVEVNKEVNASLCKGGHAADMVRAGINMVDADGVYAELGHASDVELALLGVDQGIVGRELVSHSWRVRVVS